MMNGSYPEANFPKTCMIIVSQAYDIKHPYNDCIITIFYEEQTQYVISVMAPIQAVPYCFVRDKIRTFQPKKVFNTSSQTADAVVVCSLLTTTWCFQSPYEL